MPVAGDFAGVEEVIEHTKLQGELVQVGSNGFAIDGQAGVAIADRLAVLLQVTEDLIVGAVFLDDVDDVLDLVRRTIGEGDLFVGSLHAIGLDNGGRPLRQVLVDLGGIKRSQRAVEQRPDVGGWPVQLAHFRLFGLWLRPVVRPGSLPFGRGHVKPATGSRGQKGHGHGHPLGGHKADRLDHSLASSLRREQACIHHRNRIAGCVGHIQAASIPIDRQSHRLRAKVTLRGKARIEVSLHGELSRAHIHGGHSVAVG